jgi:uncharacterized membrane protein (UPF0127 family)
VLVGLAVALAALAGAGCGRDSASGDGTASTAPAGETRTVTVGDAPPLTVEIADSFTEHAVGLMGRRSLPPDAGMLFVFDQPQELRFFMKDTLIPLDILWIRDGQVIGIDTMHPEPGVPDDELRRYRSPGPADRALEVNAGWASANGVQVGDRVVE